MTPSLHIENDPVVPEIIRVEDWRHHQFLPKFRTFGGCISGVTRLFDLKFEILCCGMITNKSKSEMIGLNALGDLALKT